MAAATNTLSQIIVILVVIVVYLEIRLATHSQRNNYFDNLHVQYLDSVLRYSINLIFMNLLFSLVIRAIPYKEV